MLKKLLIFSFLAFLITLGSAVVFIPDFIERVTVKVRTAFPAPAPDNLFVPTPAAGSIAEIPTPIATVSAKLVKGKISPTPTLIPLPQSFMISTFRHEYQKWNNCGPATTAMMLSFLDYVENQKQIAPFLKPNYDDKNVSPEQIVAYINSKPDLRAIYRINGNERMMKQLMIEGYPVIVENWFNYKPNDGMGHYRLFKGYNDVKKEFYFLDSYRGPNTVYSYEEFDENWKVFNRTYVVAFKKEDEQKVQAIIGESLDDLTMYDLALQKADEEIRSNEKDPYAWFNRGSVLSAQGKHEEAVKAFDTARRLTLPWRMLWYQFRIFDSYLAVGRNDDVITLTSANIKLTGGLEESYYHRGKAYEAQGQIELAKKDYQQALKWNKDYEAAKIALEGK